MKRKQKMNIHKELAKIRNEANIYDELYGEQGLNLKNASTSEETTPKQDDHYEDGVWWTYEPCKTNVPS